MTLLCFVLILYANFFKPVVEAAIEDSLWPNLLSRGFFKKNSFLLLKYLDEVFDVTTYFLKFSWLLLLHLNKEVSECVQVTFCTFMCVCFYLHHKPCLPFCIMPTASSCQREREGRLMCGCGRWCVWWGPRSVLRTQPADLCCHQMWLFVLHAFLTCARQGS